MQTNDRHTWTNWSGSLHCTPSISTSPESERDIVELLRKAQANRQHVRVAGSGHSSSPLVPTSDMLVHMDAFQDVIDHDPENCEATIQPGITLGDAGEALYERGLAFHNLGDIDKQTVTGAVVVGTHGSGRTLKNLGSILVGGRLILADGSIRDVTRDSDPELLSALQVSLGLLGVLTQLRIRLEPAYRLHRREWCAHVEDCLEHLDELVEDHRNMDFYWYPRRDEVKIRTMAKEGEPAPDLPYASLLEEEIDWSHRIIAQTRDNRFEEMEYALPADAGPECFREIRERVKRVHRQTVGWRVLYRTVAADDAWLSPAYGRDTVTISLHQNASLPYQEYFDDIEPILRAYGGRPHWGKKFSLASEDLRPLYPGWDDFQRVRRELDPTGLFLTPELARLMGD